MRTTHNLVHMDLTTWMCAVGLDDAAEKANVSRSTVSRLRRGKAQLSKPLAATLYLLTGGQVTPNDFYDLPALPEAAGADAAEAA